MFAVAGIGGRAGRPGRGGYQGGGVLRPAVPVRPGQHRLVTVQLHVPGQENRSTQARGLYQCRQTTSRERPRFRLSRRARWTDSWRSTRGRASSGTPGGRRMAGRNRPQAMGVVRPGCSSTRSRRPDRPASHASTAGRRQGRARRSRSRQESHRPANRAASTRAPAAHTSTGQGTSSPSGAAGRASASAAAVPGRGAGRDTLGRGRGRRALTSTEAGPDTETAGETAERPAATARTAPPRGAASGPPSAPPGPPARRALRTGTSGAGSARSAWDASLLYFSLSIRACISSTSSWLREPLPTRVENSRAGEPWNRPSTRCPSSWVRTSSRPTRGGRGSRAPAAR